MLADELRTMADDLSRRLAGKGCTMNDATLLANLYALAAKLEGKVVARAQTRQSPIVPDITYAYIISAAADGTTETEAIAALQKLLDGEG